MPPPHLSLPLNPYRLFHLSARLRLRDSPTPYNDDYYALLLTTPLPPSASERNPTPTPAPESTTKAPPASPIQTSTKAPDNKVTFGRVLSGPSPRMRGLERAEKGLERPAEPDNCCMSGCVNCVWDAYREEVEEWAAERRRRGEDEGGGVEDADGGVRGVEGGGEELFEGLEVGIREFMLTEKRLRDRRGREKGG